MNLHLGGGGKTSRSNGLQDLQASLPLEMLRSWDFLNHGDEGIMPILRHAEQGPVNSEQLTVNSSLRDITLCHPELVSGFSHRKTLGSTQKEKVVASSMGQMLKRSWICSTLEQPRLCALNGTVNSVFSLSGLHFVSSVRKSAVQHDKKKKVAFTLAEVLITLGIIGVVAAITLPALIENVTERKNSERHANIVYKVTQAMEMMKVHGELGRRYDTTEAFVDELQKYLKISKRCDANHIADCWPTDKVTDGEGNEFEISKAKTGKNLSLQSSTNNVGLILGDGASIILNYNPDSGIVDETDAIVAVKKSLPVGGGRSKEFVYTSNATASIDFVTDVNGSAAPNAETSNNQFHDIRNLTAARFKGCVGAELSGIGCVIVVGTGYDKIDTCNDSTWDSHGTSNSSCHKNRWAGAKAKCASMGMSLPDKGTLKNIAAQKASNPALPQSGDFWSSSEINSYSATTVRFYDKAEINHWKDNNYSVLCVGE